MSDTAQEQVRAMLRQWGIDAPEEDIPFLCRSFQRQRALLARMDAATPTDTEPAHVFRPLS